MKKSVAVVVLGVLAAAVSSQAQTVTNVTKQMNVTLQAMLSDNTKVTDANLAGTGPLAILNVDIIEGATTNPAVLIAKSVGVASGQLTNAVVLLEENAQVDLGHGAFMGAFGDTGRDPNLAGAALLVSGVAAHKVSHGTTNDTVVARLNGIWKDGATVIKNGIVKSVKVR